MTDTDSTTDPAENSTDESPPVVWRHTPTYFIDGVIGMAFAGGMHRLSLGEIVFNPIPGAERPMSTPVCGLVVSPEGLDLLISALQDAKAQREKPDDTDA